LKGNAHDASQNKALELARIGTGHGGGAACGPTPAR
jgi:hypothetical protein